MGTRGQGTCSTPFFQNGISGKTRPVCKCPALQGLASTHIFQITHTVPGIVPFMIVSKRFAPSSLPLSPLPFQTAYSFSNTADFPLNTVKLSLAQVYYKAISLQHVKFTRINLLFYSHSSSGLS